MKNINENLILSFLINIYVVTKMLKGIYIKLRKYTDFKKYRYAILLTKNINIKQIYLNVKKVNIPEHISLILFGAYLIVLLNPSYIIKIMNNKIIK